MRPDLLRFGEWVKRIGVQRLGWTPEIADVVQPVIVLADHSHLVSRVDLAQGLDAMSATVVVGNFRGYQLQANSPGGSILHYFHVANPAGAGATDSQDFVYGIAPPFAPVSGTPSCPINPFKACVNTRSTYNVGASYLVGVAGDCAFTGSTNTGVRGGPGGEIRGPIWIPPGRALIVEGFFVSMGLRGHCYWTELPAPGAEAGPAQ